ncbi:CatB-related O-acetyltransferase [Flavobacterium sp.]|uniref:CatB-related O-acetyltransferase n=1 Tax=Flavobacterium sp. TaxID=239 RepID=UPI00375186C6
MIQYIEYLLSKIIKKLHLRAIKNCDIHKTSKVCSGSHLINVTMGKHSDVGYDCTIVNTEIGAFCSLGANIIIGGASHTVDWVSTSPVFNENKDHLTKKFSYHKFNLENHTSIGNDVWIGNCVLIKSNLKIGDGVVIGMGSVVTKDIPPYEIWAGNPAKLIKKRFENDVAAELLKIKWWEWEDKKIQLYASSFNNVPELIRKLQSKK